MVRRDSPGDAIWSNARQIADDRAMSTELASEFWNDHADEYDAIRRRRMKFDQISSYWRELSEAWKSLANASHICLEADVYLAAHEDVSQTITLGNASHGLGLRSALQIIAAIHRQDAFERSIDDTVAAIDLVLGLGND